MRKQDAATAARETALSEPVLVKVLEHSGGEKFVTDIGTIWLKNVPAQTIQFLANRIQLANQVNAMNARVEANDREAQYANSIAATNAYYNYYNPFYDPMPQTMQANLLTDSVHQQRMELDRQLKVFDDYNRQGEHLSTVVASKTTKQYMGIDIWTCFGIAPQQQTNAPPTQ